VDEPTAVVADGVDAAIELARELVGDRADADAAGGADRSGATADVAGEASPAGTGPVDDDPAAVAAREHLRTVVDDHVSMLETVDIDAQDDGVDEDIETRLEALGYR
jgi:hypothetical protein